MILTLILNVFRISWIFEESTPWNFFHHAASFPCQMEEDVSPWGRLFLYSDAC